MGMKMEIFAHGYNTISGFGFGAIVVAAVVIIVLQIKGKLG